MAKVGIRGMNLLEYYESKKVKAANPFDKS